ncbi:hypothetical protein F2P81_024724 [Scophthalmus maximus]|uniref:Uncharacterized protein n=1 Tax=Scophthalmus maximus TaxID=52904 RepID=A0A6A4RLL4_SCOMX|nr:hypothetical protein F2P81_024724 [Scophthalmus maximus]
MKSGKRTAAAACEARHNSRINKHGDGRCPWSLWILHTTEFTFIRLLMKLKPADGKRRPRERESGNNPPGLTTHQRALHLWPKRAMSHERRASERTKPPSDVRQRRRCRDVETLLGNQLFVLWFCSPGRRPGNGAAQPPAARRCSRSIMLADGSRA